MLSNGKRFWTLFNFPLRLLKRFYYQNLVIRTKEDALFNIHNCKNINTILKTPEEVRESLQKIKKLKLPLHQILPKNWDLYRIFSFIMKHGVEQSKILDVGASNFSIILSWLELYGFSNLFGCDISIKKDFRKGNINYYAQNLHNTNFPSNYFDFITSISVIEHGVDLKAYLREMSRLLKKGGYLFTSADYWPTPIQTKGIYPYGKELGEMKIFTRPEIETLIQSAKIFDLELIQPINWDHIEKVVHWTRVNKRFTFIFFTLRKIK